MAAPEAATPEPEEPLSDGANVEDTPNVPDSKYPVPVPEDWVEGRTSAAETWFQGARDTALRKWHADNNDRDNASTAYQAKAANSAVEQAGLDLFVWKQDSVYLAG
ncbi:hypothetical protein FOA52_006860 [Chlamydomonas sp. UWO 241]|nr:hypothetical protein FOA52_006860 [Chlamydomonas sp. UWO 241]